MAKPEFVYVTYIATTPEKVWEAIVDPKITARYWQHENVSDWKPGSRWEHHPQGDAKTVKIVGKVIEASRPNRLVMSWAWPADEKTEAKHSRVTFTIEPVAEVVKLTVVHERFDQIADMLPKIQEGWPKVLSSLKSMLESGRPLPKLW